jgi:FPC/CPF motif-containing protein YcgG
MVTDRFTSLVFVYRPLDAGRTHNPFKTAFWTLDRVLHFDDSSGLLALVSVDSVTCSPCLAISSS